VMSVLGGWGWKRKNKFRSFPKFCRFSFWEYVGYSDRNTKSRTNSRYLGYLTGRVIELKRISPQFIHIILPIYSKYTLPGLLPIWVCIFGSGTGKPWRCISLHCIMLISFTTLYMCM
jgi:hypothetical protein